eukprot:622296-Pleurochrysis_carterae.AAC.2
MTMCTPTHARVHARVHTHTLTRTAHSRRRRAALSHTHARTFIRINTYTHTCTRQARTPWRARARSSARTGDGTKDGCIEVPIHFHERVKSLTPYVCALQHAPSHGQRRKKTHQSEKPRKNRKATQQQKSHAITEKPRSNRKATQQQKSHAKTDVSTLSRNHPCTSTLTAKARDDHPQ